MHESSWMNSARLALISSASVHKMRASPAMPSISNAVLTVLPVSPLLEANVWPLLMVCPTRMSELLPGGAGFHASFGMNNGTGV